MYWKLEISSNKDAAIIACEFVADISYSMENYDILRTECGKIIGTLPQIKSVQELFYLKKRDTMIYVILNRNYWDGSMKFVMIVLQMYFQYR